MKKTQDKKLKIFSLHSKRAQMKIQQMAFMLIAVTLFFALVGMFVLVWKFSGVRESATELEERNAMFLVTKLANSPEFSCGQSYGNKANCVDFDKLMMLKEKSNVYKDFWGVESIEVRKILGDEEILCTTNNYPDCNLVEMKLSSKGGYTVSNFVSLCRKDMDNEGIYDNCEVARFILSYERK